MDEKFYQILVGVLVVVVIFSLIKPASKTQNYNVNVSTSTSAAADGLDLQAVGALIKKTKDAEDLEKLVNDKSVGINNLDLNEDGNVDYIKVTEFGDDSAKGFSLTVEPVKGEEQEVATIHLEKSSDKQASVEVRGNRQIYGSNHYYHSYFPIGSLLLWSYLWRPHPFYASPWGYGYYPSYYRSYPRVGVSAYQNRTRTVTRGAGMKPATTSSMKSNIKSPKAGKTASSIKAPLKNPSTSQKSFQKRNPSKSVRKGGFGRGSRSGSRPSVRSSSFGRSGGFRGGK